MNLGEGHMEYTREYVNRHTLLSRIWKSAWHTLRHIHGGAFFLNNVVHMTALFHE